VSGSLAGTTRRKNHGSNQIQIQSFVETEINQLEETELFAETDELVVESGTY
jgi:hypothetical protein